MWAFKALIIGVAAIILLTSLGAYMVGLRDFETEQITTTKSVATAVGVGNATVQLAKNLWESSLDYASVASNLTDDAPVLTTYNSTSRAVTIDGLSDNTTRVLTIIYKTDGLTEYESVEGVTRIVPVVIIAAVVAIAGVAVVYAFMRR